MNMSRFTIAYWRRVLTHNIFSLDRSSRRFKKYLESQTQTQSSSLNSKSLDAQILVEFEQAPDNLIALNIFLPLLRSKYDAKTISYLMTKKSKFPKIVQIIRYRFSVTNKIVGKELKIIKYEYQSAISSFPQIIELIEQIKTPEELLNLTVEGIEIGDLIYDKYLAYQRNHTADFEDPNLRETLAECLYYFFHWRNYLRKTEVKAICISHSVYHFGIPARIAVSQGIETFQVSAETIYRMSDTRSMAFREESDFPEEFANLSLSKQRSGIEQAKKRLQSRFSGNLSSDMPYVFKSAFQESNVQIKNREFSTQLVMLVAAHDFYDSPHVFGKNLYPDFYLWLKKIGELSNKTNYLWLVKTHPFLRGSGRDIIENLTREYPKLNLLPSEVGHNDLLKYGIDAVFTVYGTIAMEYACFQIPTINASTNNPHVAYHFSYTPKSTEEYEEFIINYSKKSFRFDFDSVYEYYFMKHIRYRKSWIFQNYELYLEDTKFGVNPMDRSVYDYYLSDKNNMPSTVYKPILLKFLENKSYKFQIES